MRLCNIRTGSPRCRHTDAPHQRGGLPKGQQEQRRNGRQPGAARRRRCTAAERRGRTPDGALRAVTASGGCHMVPTREALRSDISQRPRSQFYRMQSRVCYPSSSPRALEDGRGSPPPAGTTEGASTTTPDILGNARVWRSHLTIPGPLLLFFASQAFF